MASLISGIVPATLGRSLERPFFIIGCPRSGTTLLIDTLSVHKEIATYPGEVNERWHPQTYPWRDSTHKAEFPPFEVDPIKFTALSLKLRSPDQEKELRSTFAAFSFLMGRKCFLTKSAMITLMIPYILDQFPNARFIHIYRDGRGVAFSWAKMLIERTERLRDYIKIYQEHNYDLTFDNLLVNCAKSWRLQIEEVERFKRQHDLVADGRLLELSYEAFCSNPHENLARMAGFMDISVSPFEHRSYDHVTDMNQPC